MKTALLHFRFRIKQVFREQAYVVSTLIFPALFFLIFALPNATSPERAKFLLGSFSSFAILSVAVLQFGVQFSTELRSQWSQYLRTLPVGKFALVGADIAKGLVMGTFSVLVVLTTVLLSTDLLLSPGEVLGLIGLQLVLAIPFSLFSAGLAFWVKPEAALPIFNLIYILGSFAGGLWLPPEALPEKLKDLSIFLPTRHLGEITWAYLLHRPFPSLAALGLIIFFGFSLGLYFLSLHHRHKTGWRT